MEQADCDDFPLHAPTAPSMLRWPLATASLTTSRIISDEPDYVGHWMEHSGAVIYRPGAVCIGLERHGQLVAGTLFDHFNGASMFGNIVITGPIIRAWLVAFFHYVFIASRAQVLIGLVASTNPTSLHFVKHLGFTEAGAIPHAAPDGTLHVMTLQREHCRFLRRPYV